MSEHRLPKPKLPTEVTVVQEIMGKKKGSLFLMNLCMRGYKVVPMSDSDRNTWTALLQQRNQTSAGLS